MITLIFRFLLVNLIYFPLLFGLPFRFAQGRVVRCLPNAGVTYANGYLEHGSEYIDGINVVFATTPDGTPVASVLSGPHTGYPNWPHGYFSHILGANGPRELSTYFWTVNDQGQRTSVIIHLHTDGTVTPTSCQQADLLFTE